MKEYDDKPAGLPAWQLIRAATSFLLVALSLWSCAPSANGAGWQLGDSSANTSPINDAENLDYRYPQAMPMAGDPDFDSSSLRPEVSRWHERLLRAMQHDDQILDSTELAQSDDAYEYGRGLYTYNQSLLLGLRATGDLRFLDEVARITEIMRGNLSDSWCGGVEDEVYVGTYGDVRGRDGYLNFRRRYDEGETYCRDSADLEEAMVHGHLAMVMYAFHLNRDLESPAGYDYGELADAWQNYLRNHFEAKWRERSGTSRPNMEFINLRFCHTYSTFSLYYYYMGRMLSDTGHRDAIHYQMHAERLTDQLFETPYVPRQRSGGLVRTETPFGDAVVYSFGSPGWEIDPDSPEAEACPTTYARYMVASVVQLRLEGFHRWDDAVMTMIANGLAHFVFDTEAVSATPEPLAAGVTGDGRVAGIPGTEYRDRLTTTAFAVSSLANMIPWDSSGRIESVARQAYEQVEDDLDNPQRVHLPASFLLEAALGQTPNAGEEGDTTED